VKPTPTFEDIFAVMAAASVGDMAARVAVPEDAQIDDTATKFALALNILLDDLALKAADAKREVAERGRLAARLQILADASHEFSAATGDLRHLLDVVARRLGEAVGDLCVIRTLTDDGEWLEPGGAVFHVDADLVAVVQEVALAGRQRVGERVRQVISTAQPVLIPKTDTATFATTTDRSYAPFLERFNVASSLTVPLLCRRTVVGIASLLRSGADHPFEEDDVRFVQSLADHAALAIANARSYGAERSARDAAEKATARFARLSEAGVIGIVVIDLDGRRVLDINDTLVHLLACSRDELVSGRVPWASLTPPEWSDVDALAIEQLTTLGVAGLREKEFIRKDGRRVPVLAGSAMLGAGTTECISFVLDLTERKEAERGRREAERRAERMVESATVGMWTVDSEGRTTFMNARMANILGMELAEALVTPVAQFFLTEDRPDLSERLATRRAGVASAYERRFPKPDGTVGVLWIEGSPMHDAQGRYEGVLGIVTDVTERRRAEEALRASETRYRLMFDNSPLPKWMYDAETLRFLDVNEATLREYGYSREEFLSMTIKDIRPPEDVPALLEAERQVELHPKFGIWRLRKKSGEIIQVELTKHTFRLGDRLTRLAVGRDVTERLRLEEQLRQSQKMEAVGRLAGGVAHDFNNVLSVILSYGDLLLGDMKPGEPMRDDVEEIRKAGQRAADLTRQLLMFSRQQVLEPRVLDLNEVLANMDKMLQRILGADVDLVSLPSKPLGRVRVDRSSVDQVIMNLVVNARDAMPTGGQLTMETANANLDEAYARDHLGVTPGPHVMLAVTDTGTGMDKPTLARIFEPFFTTKGSGKGTGLGLSTVFGIVQQSGGSVWVYSEPGKGTTFKVYFPRVDAAVESVRPVEPLTTVRGSETILLVEDDDQVRAVARGILVKNGYHVMEARNAGEALLISEKHPSTIHLLLSDVVMPQMSGPELAKRLAASRPLMRVLCMSGYTDDSIVRHGVLEAHLAYLQKPITPDALTTRVREVLDAKPPESLLS
jgi:two-component system, cell cycle sensor histidine kinase and response regulator CckA